ncbi:hypothetical protein BDR26DRAFT_849433 [Obelidium mucronatum]|nr:hypothetical protein BDR26DRAFT_849433 [Obelidium mucronatum]
MSDPGPVSHQSVSSTVTPNRKKTTIQSLKISIAVAIILLLSIQGFVAYGLDSRPAITHKHICSRFPKKAPINPFKRQKYDGSSYTASVPRLALSRPPSSLRVVAIKDTKAIPKMMCEATLYSACYISEIEDLYFRKWNTPDVVVSTEMNCWPFWHADICSPGRRPSRPNSTIEYVNAGVVIGKVAPFTAFVSEIMKMFSEGLDDDQHIVSKLVYESHERNGYLMDHSSELSGSQQPPAPIFAEFQLYNRSYFVSLESKTYFRDRVLIPEVKDSIGDYVVFMDGENKRIRDLCPFDF